MKPSEPTTEIQEFFEQWNIYQKIIKFNYLLHRELFTILHNFLNTHGHNPFILLDLGCGDASLMTRALQETNVSQYHGIDVSEVALTYAKNNLETINCKKIWLLGDFAKLINNFQNQFDFIIAGYSMHHLQREEKGLI